MKRTLVLFLCLLVMLNSLPAQKINYDSLLAVAQKARRVNFNMGLQVYDSIDGLLVDSPLTKWHIRSYLGRGVIFAYMNNLDSANNYFDKALYVSTEINDSSAVPKIIGNRALAYSQRGDTKRALKDFESILEIFLGRKDTVPVLKTYVLVGIQYVRLDKTNLALNALLKGVEYVGNDTLIREVGTIYQELGALYSGKEQSQLAKDYYLKAVNLFRIHGDTNYLLFSYPNLAEIYAAEGDYKTADEYLQITENNLKITANPVAKVHYYKIKGLVRLGQRDTLAAINNLKLSLKIAESQNLFRQINIAASELSALYLKLNNWDEAEKYASIVIKISKQESYLALRRRAEKIMSEAYARKKDYKKAYVHLLDHMELNDTLFNKEKIEEFKEIELTYEYDKEKLADSLKSIEEKKNLEIAFQEKVMKEKLSRNLIAFAGICVAIITLLIFIAFRRKRKLANELNSKNLIIEKALNNNELLLKEIHHRVKNNFQIVSSLLEMQAKGIEDEKAKELAIEGKNRVKSMAIIHQRLYQNNELSIDFFEYIQSLTDEIVNMYDPDKKVDVKIIAENKHLDIDTAIPAGLILNELITNAFKYGLNKPKKKLEIELREIEDQKFRLKVKDNGKGLPNAFDPMQAKTLGLRLVRRLSKQLQGSFSYNYENGSIFEVTFLSTLGRKEIN